MTNVKPLHLFEILMSFIDLFPWLNISIQLFLLFREWGEAKHKKNKLNATPAKCGHQGKNLEDQHPVLKESCQINELLMVLKTYITNWAKWSRRGSSCQGAGKGGEFEGIIYIYLYFRFPPPPRECFCIWLASAWWWSEGKVRGKTTFRKAGDQTNWELNGWKSV